MGRVVELGRVSAVRIPASGCGATDMEIVIQEQVRMKNAATAQ